MIIVICYSAKREAPMLISEEAGVTNMLTRHCSELLVLRTVQLTCTSDENTKMALILKTRLPLGTLLCAICRLLLRGGDQMNPRDVKVTNLSAAVDKRYSVKDVSLD